MRKKITIAQGKAIAIGACLGTLGLMLLIGYLLS